MPEHGPGLRISLAPQSSAPNHARRHLRAMLRGRLPELLEQRALLLISELATIAVLHRKRSAIAVWATYDAPWLRAEMREVDVHTPLSGGEPDLDDANNGVELALRLVDCFAGSWGDLEEEPGYWFEVSE